MLRKILIASLLISGFSMPVAHADQAMDDCLNYVESSFHFQLVLSTHLNMMEENNREINKLIQTWPALEPQLRVYLEDGIDSETWSSKVYLENLQDFCIGAIDRQQKTGMKDYVNIDVYPRLKKMKDSLSEWAIKHTMRVNTNATNLAVLIATYKASLPKPKPIVATPKKQESTIICSKKKETLRVSGVRPICPIGFKKK